MELLVSLLAFGATFLLVMGVAAFLRPRVAGRRLARLGSVGAAAEGERESLIVNQEGNAVVRAIGRLGQRSADAGEAGPLRQRLIHAGYRSQSAPAVFYGLRLVLALALPSLMVVLPIAWKLPHLQLVLILCLAAGFGFVAPSLALDMRRNRRQNEIRRVLPDALDLLVVCVEAGYAINQSLARVSDEFAKKSPNLSTEFGLVTAETRTGKSMTDALRSLADRTGVEDISSLVALLVQTERFGTSVANALRVHADAMRVRRMQRAEERAQKAPLKLIFPATLIFAALMMIFMAPSVYRFSQAFPD
ncbi:MAG: type II secretion system F family protein [Myxococcota bacterium]